MYSKIEFNSIACAKISTKTSNTRLCAYRCVEGWRKHLKLGGDIHKTYIYVFSIHMLLYCAFGGHLKALHLLAILGGFCSIFWQIWWWGRHPHCPHPFRRPWVYVASYVQWCDVDSGPLWITQWGKCTKIFSFNLYENYDLFEKPRDLWPTFWWKKGNGIMVISFWSIFYVEKWCYWPS